MTVVRTCKECGPVAKPRPAPHPGPRCATHWRVEKRRRSAAQHARSIQKTYNLTADIYQVLYEAQGGCCAICQRARGLKRKLAVDHDHECCPGPTSCGSCIRGLLCSTCNRVVLGRYSREALQRAISYLDAPPFQQLGSAPGAARATP